MLALGWCAVASLGAAVRWRPNLVMLGGTGISSGGALRNSSTTAATYAGLISLDSASSIVGDTGSISLSNTGTLFWKGYPCPVRGRVSMDLVTISLDNIPEGERPQEVLERAKI
jgi:hypothetical protein